MSAMFFDVGVRKYPARLHKRICQKATFGSLTTGLYAKFCTMAINNMSIEEVTHHILGFISQPG